VSSPGEARVARRAVTVTFGASGLLIASLAVRTPSIQQDLQLTTGRLGLLSALFGLTAVATMQVTARLTSRFGSRSLVRAAAVVQPVLLLGVGIAPDLVTLAAVEIVLGAVVGLLDVSVNAHAVTIERALGRPVMNGCHAAWSLGSVGGALLGAGAAHLGVSRGAHYAVLAAPTTPCSRRCSCRSPPRPDAFCSLPPTPSPLGSGQAPGRPGGPGGAGRSQSSARWAPSR